MTETANNDSALIARADKWLEQASSARWFYHYSAECRQPHAVMRDSESGYRAVAHTTYNNDESKRDARAIAEAPELIAALRAGLLARHQEEIVICAAVKVGALIIRGHRHDDCLRNIRARRLYADPIVQGFVTSRNRFVSREEAMQIQKAADAPSAYSLDGKLHGDILVSEDLY